MVISGMMISACSPDTAEWQIIVQPNRSMSWTQSMWLLAGITVLLLSISTVFALKGLWLILPFAGLEVAALAYCMYRVADSGYLCEVISIGETEIRVEKGRQRRCRSTRGGPEATCTFPRGWARVLLIEDRGSWYPNKVLIGASGRQVELGAFLVEDEKKDLVEELRRVLANEHLPTAHCGEGSNKKP